ncbi:Porphobilinogen deaminase (PBG) (Hydroxymethylbilane synthase) (HMBS) (Pre-uroporphyrinogen synthase), partial [Durusdinium trenchii]
AHHLAERIAASPNPWDVEIVHISTIGDRDRREPLSQMGGQGVFTREVQLAVLDGRADVAVHSLKDLPTTSTPGLSLSGFLERAPRFDALVLPRESDIERFEQLPPGARIGTGSLRRRAQLLHARPELQMNEIRGNVDTRLKKLDDGEFDAIILAEAGLRRLECDDRISCVLAPPLMYPAVGQAAIGIECRDDDELVQGLLASLSHSATRDEVLAERACLATLRAGCHAPVGVLTSWEDGDQLALTGVVLSPDGTERFEASDRAVAEDAVELGARVAQQLIDAGAGAILWDESSTEEP